MGKSEGIESSKACPRTPPSPMKDLNLYLRPNPILVAVSLTLILTTAGLVYYWMLPKPLLIIDEEPIERTPPAVITIDGDANFSATALLEGWPGDGSPENPFIIDGLDIDLGGEIGHCIDIRNTRVSFTITNCNLTGATWYDWAGFVISGAGIYLRNVSNGELVNNTCSNNIYGIHLEESDSNTLANNTCNNNYRGIDLYFSDSNIVVNNTCTSNGYGLSLEESNSNTVENNTCNNNANIGISLSDSDSNTVANNICNNNSIGISFLYNSGSNTVENNTCNNNTEYGVSLAYSSSNIITNNTLNGCGFFFSGTLAQCRQLEVTGNIVNTLPLVFLQDQVGDVVSSPAGQVILVGCSQVTVKDQTLMNCSVGILLSDTKLTTLVNNTCNNNYRGIDLYFSDSNIVVNNTCNSNEIGISLRDSNSTTVANNTCNSNVWGISLAESPYNTVSDNTCSYNTEYGIDLHRSHINIVTDNTCNYNRIGIYIYDSDSNTVTDNTFLGNTEHEFETEEYEYVEWYYFPVPEEYDPAILLLIGELAVVILLGAGWRMAKLSRVVSKGE